MEALPQPFQHLIDASENPTRLEADARFPLAWHRWSTDEQLAICQAWASRRPLLVRGEAGCGKSQLARALATVLGVPLFCEVIHPRFEATDLLYRDDPIARLAQAQLIAATKPQGEYDKLLDWVSERLDPGHFVKPGVIWSAAKSPAPDARSKSPLWPRAVVLIDEIDKADSDVPNALLEVLGNRSFEVPGEENPISVGLDHAPLILVTTNEDRELPPAFLRRCAVLNLRPDDGNEHSFVTWLKDRASVHAVFGTWVRQSDGPLDRAASQVWDDRKAAANEGLSTVGLAEYLDLLYSLHRLSLGDPARAIELLKDIYPYALVKHRSQHQKRPQALKSTNALKQVDALKPEATDD